jgi:putative hydrolase of the HAD superfamily
VSFDFGDTIVALDERLLLQKLEREGLSAELARLEAALPSARSAYNAAIASGAANHPWKPFMRALLEHAGAEPASELERVVEALWLDQPRHNLWRKLLPGMPELCRELKAAGVPIGILTNSEGRAQLLAEELGLATLFEPLIDSGVFGVAKPDPRIFDAFATAMRLPAAEIVHVGDSLRADVLGALGAGMQAIWFAGREEQAPPGVAVCEDANALRAEFVRRGLLR